MPDSSTPALELPELVAELLGLVRALTLELHPDRASTLRVRLDSDFDGELGFDSLARVELLDRVSRHFAVSLPADLLGRFETPLELVSALLEAEGWPAARQLELDLELALGPSLTMPDRAHTLIEVLDWHAREHGSRVHALSSDGANERERLSFAELDRRARAVAAGLRARDLVAGDRVALLADDPARFIVAFFGVLYAGGVVVPCDLPGESVVAPLHEVRARALIVAPSFDRGAAAILRERVATLEIVADLDELTQVDARLAPVRRDPWDLALVLYTAGCEGAPKGVMLTHANLLANIRATVGALSVVADDRVVSWLPLAHDMGLIGAWLTSLYAGATLVAMPPRAFARDPACWLATLGRTRATITVAPNSAYARCSSLAALPDALDLGCLRLAIVGGEPIAAATLREFSRRFAEHGLDPRALEPAYGLAEASAAVALARVEQAPRIDRIDRRVFARTGAALVLAADSTAPALELVCCGRPLPGHELRVVDPDGHESAARQQGRVQFRGPSATPGYFGDPDATARLAVEVEWRETGDLGYVADGELFVTGRSKDLIVRAGHGIHPDELEREVGRIAGVRPGAVVAFGQYDERRGTERLVIAVETLVRDEQERERMREAILVCSAELLDAPADEVVLVGPRTLPRSGSAKLRRSRCRELHAAGRLGAHPRTAWSEAELRGARARAAARKLSHLLYAAWFWTASFTIALALWPVVLVLPRPAWRWAALRGACRLIFAVAGIEIAVRGRAPSEQAVIVCNHQSYLDSLLLAAVVPGHATILAKRELAKNPVSRSLLGRAGILFVERYEPRRAIEATELALARVRAGQTLVVFPEGATTRRPGLAGFRLGAFRVASATQLPVVPAVIRGSRNVLRGQLMFPRRGRISVEFGPAMRASGEGWAATVGLRDQARAWILERCGEPDLDGEEHPLVTRLRRKLSGRRPA